MRRTQNELVRELEGPQVSLALVVGSLVAFVNVASALITLAMAG
jgi:hypothetical protein